MLLSWSKFLCLSALESDVWSMSSAWHCGIQEMCVGSNNTHKSSRAFNLSTGMGFLWTTYFSPVQDPVYLPSSTFTWLTCGRLSLLIKPIQMEGVGVVCQTDTQTHILTLMLLLANVSNTKWCKKTFKKDWNLGAWVLIWEYAARFRWFSKTVPRTKVTPFIFYIT